MCLPGPESGTHHRARAVPEPTPAWLPSQAGQTDHRGLVRHNASREPGDTIVSASGQPSTFSPGPYTPSQPPPPARASSGAALYHSGTSQVVGEAADARTKVCLKEDCGPRSQLDRSRLSPVLSGVVPWLGYGLRFANYCLPPLPRRRNLRVDRSNVRGHDDFGGDGSRSSKIREVAGCHNRDSGDRGELGGDGSAGSLFAQIWNQVR